jgi:hypothetical protein
MSPKQGVLEPRRVGGGGWGRGGTGGVGVGGGGGLEGRKFPTSHLLCSFFLTAGRILPLRRRQFPIEGRGDINTRPSALADSPAHGL